MKEAIIFGGSFNPPTTAHTEVMRHCLAQPEIDEVWVMPSGERQDKAFTTSDRQRLDMLKTIKQEVFENDARLVISDFELHLPRPTQTCRTLGALGLAFPDTRFWFAFGVDAYRSMPTWSDGERLQRELPMYVLPRDGDKPAEAPNVRLLPAVGRGSSSLVREAILQHQPFEQFVPASIAQYVRTRQLYAVQ